MADVDETSSSGSLSPCDPMEEEVWFEAQWEESLPNKIRAGTPVIELFNGAHSVFKNVNPDTFLLPLNSIVVCMKLDVLGDMAWCVQNGWVPNNAACSQRLASIWTERQAKRVFLLFSVKTTKQFCAFAEMIGSTDYNVNVDGWSKEGCNGAVPVTFLYIKNVPFTIINHMASKENGQPVTNMWNSMMYNNQQAREVVMRYVKHPNVASILLFPPGIPALPTNFGLLIPSSGQSTYSASSFGSGHNKINDKRSGLVAYNRPTGDRRIPDAPWRSLGTPKAVAGIAGDPGTRTRALSTAKNVSFEVLTDAGDGSSSEQSSTFTTPDEQTIAGFHQARQQTAAGQIPTSSSGSDMTHKRGGLGSFRGGLHGGSGGRAKFAGMPINTDWRNNHSPQRRALGLGGTGAQVASATDHTQSMEYHSLGGFSSLQPTASAPPVQPTEYAGGELPASNAAGSLSGAKPITTSFQAPSSLHDMHLPGLGIQHRSLHMPSSSISSMDSDGDPFRDPFKRAREARRPRLTPSIFNPSAPSFSQPPSLQSNQDGSTAPYSPFTSTNGANSDSFTMVPLMKPKQDNPMNLRQSMPDVSRASASLSAQAPDFVPHSAKPSKPTSTMQDDTQQRTPTHKTVLALQQYSPSFSVRTDGSISPEKIAGLKPAEKAKYYMAMAQKMIFKADEAKLDMEIAEIENNYDRGALAGSTTESEPSFSPPDSAYSDNPYFISPMSSAENGSLTNSERAIIRSDTSAQPDPANTNILSVHRRGFGDSNARGFTGPFDACVESNTLSIVTSPSRETGSQLCSPQYGPSGFSLLDHGTARPSGSPQRATPLHDEDDSASLSSFDGGVDVNGHRNIPS